MHFDRGSFDFANIIWIETSSCLEINYRVQRWWSKIQFKKLRLPHVKCINGMIFTSFVNNMAFFAFKISCTSKSQLSALKKAPYPNQKVVTWHTFCPDLQRGSLFDLHSGFLMSWMNTDMRYILLAETQINFVEYYSSLAWIRVLTSPASCAPTDNGFNKFLIITSSKYQQCKYSFNINRKGQKGKKSTFCTKPV